MSKRKIVIIDYKMGNLFSVRLACEKTGMKVVISSNPDELLSADGAILPGVGAFGNAMENLNELGLADSIKSYIELGKPFMGICLGMQLLLTESDEFGRHKGLDIIKGSVLRFPLTNNNGKKLKIPQVGWNRIYKKNQEDLVWDKSPLEGLSSGCFMYFVHSYYVMPKDDSVVLSQTNYVDVTYCSSLMQRNIFACQFHPEKSGDNGLQIYKTWMEMVNNKMGGK